MNVLMLQSYSLNNINVFYSTISNHIKYCNRHNYSLLLKNEEYSTFIDYLNIINYMKTFDVVFMCGSDVVFTNIELSITSFIENFINIAQDYIDNPRLSFVNGEILIFSKIDDHIFNVLLEMNLYQNNLILNKSINLNWGTLAVINNIYSTNDPLNQYINYIPSGKLLAYDNKYLRITVQSSIWNKNSFSYHTIRYDNLTKTRLLLKFREQYPEYF